MKSIELSSSAYQLTLLQTQLYRSVRELMKLNIKQHKLSFTQWFILSHIYRGPVEGLYMSDIAQHLMLSMPQLTKIVNGLTERKLVKQRVSAKDKRRRAVRCTSTGRVLCESVELDLDAATNEWLSKLSADQQAEYFSLMRMLETNRPKFVGMRGATIVNIKRR